MKIAFVTPEYVTEKNFDGGLANHLGCVCPALVEWGHEVSVFVVSEHEDRIVQDGVEVFRIRIDKRLLKWLRRFSFRRLSLSTEWVLQSLLLNIALANSHREKTFDLVQYASYTSTALWRWSNICSVVRVSSFEPLLQQAYGLPATLDRRLLTWLEKVAIRKTNAVFGPSNLIAQVVTEEIGRHVEVIEPLFSIKKQDLDDCVYQDQLAGKKYLLFYGTLGALKGVGTIAEIIQPLLSRYSSLYFVFVGKDVGLNGVPAIQHVWEKAAHCRGRVIYLGRLRHSQLYPVLAHARAVVLPSLVDNLPNTCLEAMAMKRIVIGTRGASFEQLIKDGENGFLCDIDAPSSLLVAIEKALQLSDSESMSMGDCAAQRIEEMTAGKSIPLLLDYYRDVIKAGGTH